jgi:hypothetical protein
MIIPHFKNFSNSTNEDSKIGPTFNQIAERIRELQEEIF